MGLQSRIRRSGPLENRILGHGLVHLSAPQLPGTPPGLTPGEAKEKQSANIWRDPLGGNGDCPYLAFQSAKKEAIIPIRISRIRGAVIPAGRSCVYIGRGAYSEQSVGARLARADCSRSQAHAVPCGRSAALCFTDQRGRMAVPGHCDPLRQLDSMYIGLVPAALAIVSM